MWGGPCSVLALGSYTLNHFNELFYASSTRLFEISQGLPYYWVGERLDFFDRSWQYTLILSTVFCILLVVDRIPKSWREGSL